MVLKNVSAERHHAVPSNDDNDHPHKIQFVRIPNLSWCFGMTADPTHNPKVSGFDEL